mmetsp:Transcript_5752/g.17136  ORF Transcript_5752/g.17136 Transcript_5752/m.17136 type:complete len:243 (+) Transcript_5752:96-824(+)
MVWKRGAHVALFVCAVLAVCAAQESEYVQKLTKILESQDSAKSGKLIEAMLHHASSDEKHYSLPDISEHVDADKGGVMDKVKRKMSSVASAVTDSSQRMGATMDIRTSKLDAQTKAINALTQRALTAASKHGNRAEEIEVLSFQIGKSITLASEAVNNMEKRLKTFSQMVEEVHDISKMMHDTFSQSKKDLEKARYYANSLGGKSGRRVLWYFIILLQLFTFVGLAYYRRHKAHSGKFNKLG